VNIYTLDFSCPNCGVIVNLKIKVNNNLYYDGHNVYCPWCKKKFIKIGRDNTIKEINTFNYEKVIK